MELVGYGSSELLRSWQARQRSRSGRDRIVCGGGVLVTRCWIMPSRFLSDSGCVVAGANVGKRASVDALFKAIWVSSSFFKS